MAEIRRWLRHIGNSSDPLAEDSTARLVDQWHGVKMPGMLGPAVIITLTADLCAEE
jgi:hypothetical protein